MSGGLSGRRVLIVTHVDWRTYYQPLMLARELSRHGGEVVLLSARGNAAFSPSGESMSMSLGGSPGGIGVAGHAVRVAGESILRQWDAVICFDLASVLPAMRFAMTRRSACFRAVWFLEYEEDGYQSNRRARAGLRWLEGNAGGLDLIIDTNPWRLAGRGPWAKGVPSIIIPNVPRLADYPVPVRSGDGGLPVILYAGTSAAYAALDSLLKAMNLCDPSARSLFALNGPPDGTESLRAEAGRLGISERVTFLPSISPAGMRDFLSGRQGIGVVLSVADAHGPLNRRQPSPNKLGEYLAAGLAILASDNDSLRFVETERLGRVCDATDPGSISTAINDLLRGDAWLECAVRSRHYFESVCNFELVSKGLIEGMIRKLGGGKAG